MGKYEKSGGFGRGRNFGHGSGGRNDGHKQMFSAICASCNKECDVPFRPSGEKPVYCSDCFRTVREKSSGNAGKEWGDRRDRNDGGFRGGQRPQSSGGAIDEIKKQLAAINVKLDTLLKMAGAADKEEAPATKTEEKKSNKKAPLKTIIKSAITKTKKKKAA